MFKFKAGTKLVLKQESKEPKLTPKLIESLDELQAGDCFKDSKGEVYYVREGARGDGNVKTTTDWFSLLGLSAMGAYKVKVEPYEMVEVEEVVEEVKPKLYEIVEGEDYVKLETGDVVKFADGNVHKVVDVDDLDSCNPYALELFNTYDWVSSGAFLPENITSINGVNIHEESAEKDPYEGWIEGAKVRCLETEGDGFNCDYIEGEIYCIGFANDYPNDFGVVHTRGNVFNFGMITEDGEFVGEAFKHFELIKE